MCWCDSQNIVRCANVLSQTSHTQAYSHRLAYSLSQVQSWDDIRVSRAMGDYGREKVYDGALDSSPTPSDVQQVQAELGNILSRTNESSRAVSQRVWAALEALGVQVVTNCKFDTSSLKVNPTGKLTLGCSEEEPLLYKRETTVGQPLPFIPLLRLPNSKVTLQP